EDEQPRAAALRPIEAERRRAEPAAERGHVEIAPGDAILARRRQGEEDATVGAVDMDRNQALLRGRAGEHLRGRPKRRRIGGARGRGERGCCERAGGEQDGNARLHANPPCGFAATLSWQSRRATANGAANARSPPGGRGRLGEGHPLPNIVPGGRRRPGPPWMEKG